MDTGSDLVLLGPGDVRDFNPGQILPQPAAAIASIRAWLRPTSYDHETGEYRKHLATLEEGTGAWLTETDAYQAWHDGREPDGPSVLLATGVPGSGKSVLAAKLARDLAREDARVPVLYFFFRQIIDANQTPAAMLRDWLDQVLVYSPPLQQGLRKHAEEGRGPESLGTDGLWELLRMALAGLPGKAYCIIDALDEMDRNGAKEFLKELADLGRRIMPAKVKVLATSRPVPEVTDVLLRLSTVSQVRLDPEMVDLDISTFVKRQLETSQISLEDQARIHEAIPGRANGLFLYARLSLEAFLEPGANTEHVMAQLPADLHMIYTNLLEAHARRSGTPADIQRLVLQAATHTTRPLRLLEMSDMLRTACPSLVPDAMAAVKDTIRGACGPLLEILPSETVSVIHHTFTEYLKGTTRTNSAGYPALDSSETHMRLSQACVDYLSNALDALENGEDPLGEEDVAKGFPGSIDTAVALLRLKFPFLEYAATNWGIHVGRADLAAQARLNEPIDALFQKRLFRSHGVQLWWLRQKYNKRREDDDWDDYDDFADILHWEEDGDGDAVLYGSTHLHMAARLGLAAYAGFIVARGDLDMNVAAQHGRTAVCWAAEHGHADVIRVLLAAGADPDPSDSRNGWRPLHRAVMNHHPEAARVLLDAGVSPLTTKTMDNPGRRCGNARSTRGETPWGYVCDSGDLDMLETFLPHVHDAEALDQAVYRTASRGREPILERLLKHLPPETRAPQNLGRCLFKACEGAHLGVIKLLLAAGADPNTISYQTPAGRFFGPGQPRYSCIDALCHGLAWERRYRLDKPAAENDQQDRRILAALIDHGADPRSRHWMGNSALHHAAANSPALVRDLLELGLDANQANDDGDTPLHLARVPACITLLIDDGGAALNLRNKRQGRTPLQQMLTLRFDAPRELVPTLLAYGPDAGVLDDEGRNSLHYALERFQPEADIVERLLALGADPACCDNKGNTPLDVSKASGPKTLAIQKLLSKAGVQVDTRDAQGRTRLFRLFGGEDVRFNEAEARQLLAMGAAKDTRDARGRTLLHETARLLACTGVGSLISAEGLDVQLRFALGLGLDARAVDEEGNTLLHEFASAAADYYGEMPGQQRGDAVWGILVDELGLDAHAANNAGQKMLHILAARTRYGNLSRLSPAAEKILAVVSTDDLNARDAQGISPLHLATLRSAKFMRLLLERGADPGIRTAQGLTPLHLAVCAGSATCTGLLLDALAGRTEPMAPGFWYSHDHTVTAVPGVDDADERGWTALSYACRAGRPDLVDLLLRAGADPVRRVHLEACAEFEDEMVLWAVPKGQQSSLWPIEPFGLVIGDRSRPRCCQGAYSSRSWPCKHLTARLDDVLSLLLVKGAGNSIQRRDLLQMAVDLREASPNGKEYTVFCFQWASMQFPDLGRLAPAEAGVGGTLEDNPGPDGRWIMDFLERRRVRILGPAGTGQIQPGKRYMTTFERAMNERAYDIVQDLAENGVELSSQDPDRRPESKPAVTLLIEQGFTHLVSVILGRPAALSASEKPQMTGEGDDEDDEDCVDNDAPLFAALGTDDVPNMEMLRLLVENRGIDVDARTRGGGTTALHILAEGRYWWHVALALPYLIQHGASLNLRDSGGDTPLQRAICSRSEGEYREEAARLLARAQSKTDGSAQQLEMALLAAALRNPTLVHLVTERDYKPNAGVILALIHHLLPDILEMLLQQWPAEIVNTLGTSPAPHGHRTAFYPLHFTLVACRPHLTPSEDWRRTMLRIIDMLLRRGADPFAEYPPSARGLVLHQAILSRSEFLDDMLAWQGLEVDRRDDEGRTILHMACVHASKPGLSHVQRILALGSDPLSRDHAGRNALHHCLHGFAEHNETPPASASDTNLESIALLATRFPELVNQRTAKGQTPLLLAMHRAVISRDATAAVEYLLSIGADPNIADENGTTILHVAADGLDQPQVLQVFQRLLAEHPALDVNARNRHWQSPLWAYARGALATPRLEADAGRVRLSYLKQSSHHQVPADTVLGVFEGAGADFWARDAAGRGLLHAAAQAVEELGVERFKALHARRLDAFLEDAGGQTSLDIAASCGNKHVLAMFER